MHKTVGTLALLVLLMSAAGCGGAPDAELAETVEIIPLPEHMASRKLAQRIGTEVYDEMEALVASDPERFNPREVDYQINWGRLEDFKSGSSTFYIKIVGKSAVPFEQDPRVQELMRAAVDMVYRKIQAHKPRTTAGAVRLPEGWTAVQKPGGDRVTG